MAESSSYLIDDGAEKKTMTGKSSLNKLSKYRIDFMRDYKINDLDINPLDDYKHRDLKNCQFEWFKSHPKKSFSTKVDEYSIADWRLKMESLQGKRYTVTLTFDPKNIHGIQYSPDKQWEKLRTILWQLSLKYNFKYYMVPELHENQQDKVHAHGIMVFPLVSKGKTRSYYKIMRERSFAMEKLRVQVGLQLQNHRIHDLYQSYTSVGYQGNFQTKKKNISLQKWHDYVHGNTETKKDIQKVYKEMGITSNFLKI